MSTFKKKMTQWLCERPMKLYWLSYLENSMRRSGRGPSINTAWTFCVQLIMRFSSLSFFKKYRNDIYVNLQQITSFCLLSRVLRQEIYFLPKRRESYFHHPFVNDVKSLKIHYSLMSHWFLFVVERSIFFKMNFPRITSIRSTISVIWDSQSGIQNLFDQE